LDESLVYPCDGTAFDVWSVVQEETEMPTSRVGTFFYERDVETQGGVGGEEEEAESEDQLHLAAIRVSFNDSTKWEWLEVTHCSIGPAEVRRREGGGGWVGCYKDRRLAPTGFV
jgi:hypothetical protein